MTTDRATAPRLQLLTLDGKTYPTRAALKAAVQAYVNAAPLDIPLSDSFAYAILALHPHYDEKVGVGVQHIEVRRTIFKNRGLHVVRTDGTVIDFSWQVALRFTTSGPTLQAAAREAVHDQIAAVAVLDPSKEVHHDSKSFSQILNDWVTIERWGIKPELRHGELHDYFRHPEDERSWQEYHRREATLVLVSEEEHKRIHGRRRGSK